MSTVGAYGKMPGLGDFFRINTPAGFVTPWDLWLQVGLQAARKALGGQWQGCYMSAPLWRFTLSPAIAGRMAVQGVLMPSVDRVGRAFPLTLMWSGPRGGLAVHLAATPFFEQLEEVALDALEDQSRASLAAELNRMQPVIDADATLPPDVRRAGLDPVTDRVGSIWSAVSEGSSLLMGCQSLPDNAQLRGLLDLSSPIWNQPSERCK